MQQDLNTEFQKVFQRRSVPRCFFAPGRINLIGEHTDYNGGHVFPAAISFGTYALAAKRQDKRIRMFSMNFKNKGIVELHLDDLSYNKHHDWANYPKGMIQYLHDNTNEIHTGLDILYFGDIPNGAGLSSSASIEMVTGILFNQLYSLRIDKIELIKLGQKVENNYLGVNSGIMDQFAVGMGMKEQAIHLNSDTLEFTYAPLPLQNYKIMIIDTNKSRSLASSAYNKRRIQCEQALEELQTKCQMNHLCDITPELFEKYKQVISDPINRKRAKHVIYENHRTKQALTELQQHNFIGFGKLMNASHLSLKNDFEVTGKELDTIVEAAWKQAGVIGARMTGAGFGGCAIAIVDKNHITTFKENISQIYTDETGYEPTFYVPAISDGAKEIKIMDEVKSK